MLHIYDEINRAFGGWPWGISCWDPHAWNPASDHPKGKACDFAVGRIGSHPDAARRAKGWELAHWVQAHAAALHIAYVIWDGRIWSPARADQGWRRYMGGVYGVTTPTGRHADHLHISQDADRRRLQEMQGTGTGGPGEPGAEQGRRREHTARVPLGYSGTPARGTPDPPLAVSDQASSIGQMPQELSLFGDDEKSSPTEHSQLADPRVSASSIDLIRRALDAQGVATMSDRQLLIEQHVGRPVESLRALTETEALLVLSRLGPAARTSPSVASSWDDRDDDTWIDRL